MQNARFRTAILLAAAVTAAAPAAASAQSPAAASHTDVAAHAASAAEVARVQAHLAAVEAELLAADIAGLTPAQRQARARHIAVLRGYREAGVFPHNHVVAGRHVPVFVDEHGTHCAVGYLLAQDGRSDIVEHVRTTRNLARVHELADEPALVAWLEEAGLTLDEAARIQPFYGPWPDSEPEVRGSRAYTLASLVGVGSGGGMIAWNLLVDRDDRHGRLAGALGVGVGVAEITLAAYGAGLDRRTDRDIDGAHIAMNLGVGVLSSVFGLQTLLSPERPQQPTTTDAVMRQRISWTLAPWTPADGGGAGLRLNARF